MGLKIVSIDELDPTLVAQVQDELSQMLQERYPEVELTRGVIHDIVLFLHGVCGAINQTEINRVLNSRSLLAIRQNPQLADPELVDHVLSNFKISRKTGLRARGNITIVVTGSATMVIAADAQYSANGLNFRTNAAISARPPGTITTDINDRVLEPRGDGTFEFSVPATAEDVGESYNVRTNTKFTPTVPPQRFVTAFSADDFTGGTLTETNAQLVSRMEAGIAAPVVAGRGNITALIKSQPVFADIKNVSVIGYGDPEMTRDQHSIIPISSGGRIDIYCQTDALPQTVALRRQARLIEKRTNDSIWQLTIHRDDAPGFYEVAAIRTLTEATDSAGCQVISDQRGWDLGDDTWTPDIVTVQEAFYSRYQTAVVRFIDTLSDVSDMNIGDSQEYSVNLLTQRLIGELQDFLSSREHRSLTSDILVKSAVPCFLSINFDIMKSASESAPDLDAIRVAIASFVNNLNFPGELYSSQVMDVIHNHLVGSQAVGKLDMHGNIRQPNGVTRIIRDPHMLQIPASPSTLVTAYTTVFILQPSDIGISVVNRSI